jgi:ABC-2 type transport system permease protein
MGALFYSPVAYCVLGFFLLAAGVSFRLMADMLVKGAHEVTLLQALFGESIFFWIAVLVSVPAITMRTFAEETRTGTMEALMTAPLSDATLVAAKYAAALMFYALLWAPTTLYLVLLNQFSPGGGVFDPGMTAAAYFGVALVGALFVSVGVLISSMTKNQIVAAIATFALLFAFFMAGFAPYFLESERWIEIASHASCIRHMMAFSRGVVDTRAVVFYLSLTAWALFATVRVVEARRWRG